MARSAVAAAVVLLALLLIHGVASAPKAPKTMTARRLRATQATGHADVRIGGGPGHATRKLRQNPHAAMAAPAAGDVVLGGAKKLLGPATKVVEEGNRKLLHDSVRERATRIARKLADYDYDYRK